MKTNKFLRVLYKDRMVGTLALTKDKQIAFEYDDNWLSNGFSISPFSLPMEKRVFVSSKNHFNGLFGVFTDSLPDAWGRLILDRLLIKNNIKPGEISVLDRLAIVGNEGRGVLCYQPEYNLVSEHPELDLDFLATESKKLLETDKSEELDALYMLGGTSGGARPKIMMEIDDAEWIIKFPARGESFNVGKSEYQYSLWAKECGIDMTQTRLFPSKLGDGYFGTQRFDKVNADSGKTRIHVLTVAALLELDFEQPNLDYHDLMKLTKILTKDNPYHIENMFRRACFNVFFHNRDDHSKNFSFLYDEQNKQWHLAPAYDLTYSTTYYGEHTTSIDGNGKAPGEKELLRVGLKAGMDKKKCVAIINKVKQVACSLLLSM